MSAIEIARDRICSVLEEGFRAKPYWDGTGETIRPGPKGNPSWLYGINLDTEGTPELGKVFVEHKLGKLDVLLLSRAWYSAANDARKSVFLDIAFNQGLHGLLDYPSMLHYAELGKWYEASQQCTVKPDSPPGVIARYKRLADILLSGVEQ